MIFMVSVFVREINHHDRNDDNNEFVVTILENLLVLTLNIPSLGRQRYLPSWGPRRTTWFFCNFSTLWCGRLLKLCFLVFWNYNSVIQALLVSNILCLFISTEVSQEHTKGGSQRAPLDILRVKHIPVFQKSIY